MVRTKIKKFDSFALVREVARERIGQPRATAVLIDKRRRMRERVLDREMKRVSLSF